MVIELVEMNLGAKIRRFWAFKRIIGLFIEKTSGNFQKPNKRKLLWSIAHRSIVPCY